MKDPAYLLLLLLLLASTILLQVLALVENQMVLLQESLSALWANVRSKRAASLGMAFVVQHQSVLGDEALAAELTEMRLRLLRGLRGDLNDSGLRLLLLLLDLLVRLLLRDLNRLLLGNLLLDNLRLRGLLVLLLLVDLDLLVLLVAVRWALQNLIDDFTVRGDDLNWHWG